MSKNLYTVRIETEVIVAAESLEAAQDLASGGLFLRVVEAGEAFDCIAHDLTWVPAGWDDRSIPYGAGDDAPLSDYPQWAKVTR